MTGCLCCVKRNCDVAFKILNTGKILCLVLFRCATLERNVEFDLSANARKRARTPARSQMGNLVNGIWPNLRPKARNSIDTLYSLLLTVLLHRCLLPTQCTIAHHLSLAIRYLNGRYFVQLHFSCCTFFEPWELEWVNVRAFIRLYCNRATICDIESIWYDDQCEWIPHNRHIQHKQREKTNCIKIL